ncbi:MAG: hypothetical protein MR570_06490 [Bifidobacterium pseudolongum]|nr:hypothetical protein [Bifidobacterium pseudolongum]
MGKTIQFFQQSLDISDEDMPANLASLYPKAGKIADSAATFIDAAYKLLHDDKTMLTPQVTNSLIDAMSIAQEIVRQSAAMRRLIRTPYQTHRIFTADTTEEETGETEAEKAVA